MTDVRRDPRGPVDAAINSPEREGLTGTAPASLYTPAFEREQITIAPDFVPDEAQPAWRQDFPIDWPQDLYVERRDFMKFMVLTSAAFAVGQLWIGAQHWWRKRTSEALIQRVVSVDDVAVGAAVEFTYPNEHESCLLVRLSAAEFVAFSQKCTHLSCAVYYAVERDRLECPCHEGYFSAANGRVLQGPPPRPLPQIVLEQRGDDLVAVGMTTHGEGA